VNNLLYFINYLGELMLDDPIVCPTKKFEVETYNTVIDMTLKELSDWFETTNIGPFKDIALLSYRRIQEVHNDPTMLPKDSFIKLCEVYSKIGHRPFAPKKMNLFWMHTPFASK